MIVRKKPWVIGLGLGMLGSAQAATVLVSDSCTLANAVTSINSGSDSGGCVATTDLYGTNDTIKIPAATTTLTARVPFIQKSVTIEGVSTTAAANIIDGNATYRPFFVGLPKATPDALTVTLRNLTVTNSRAKGGNGGNGSGGGGAGLGGALFVFHGDVSVQNVIFDGNQAVGGNGGGTGTGGAGGGMEGAGGNSSYGGGGGGGIYGDGGSPGVNNGDAPSGYGAGAGGWPAWRGGNGGMGAAGGNGFDSTVGSLYGGGGASDYPGGNALAVDFLAGFGAGGGWLFGGGGGGGVNDYANNGGPAGAGGYGGGGGGGGRGYYTRTAGDAGGNGGGGGFGGGGGAGGWGDSGSYGVPAPGGFGGGGAGSEGSYIGAPGGNFAGSGGAPAAGGGGGGGAGLGGALFVQSGTLTLQRVVFQNNTVSGGAGGGGGAAGQGVGSVLFLCGSADDASCGATVAASSCGVVFGTGHTLSDVHGTDLTDAVPECTPAAATGLSATAVSAAQIDLAWSDNSSDESGFRIYRAPSGGTPVLVGSVLANVTRYSDTGLAEATSYDYYVVAFNSHEAPASNTATATTNSSTTIAASSGGGGAMEWAVFALALLLLRAGWRWRGGVGTMSNE